MFEIRKFSLNIIVNIFQGHSPWFSGRLDCKLNILFYLRISSSSRKAVPMGKSGHLGLILSRNTLRQNWSISCAKFCHGKTPWKLLPDCLIYILSHCIFEALFWPGFSSLVIKRPLRKSPPGRDSRICLLNMFIHDDYTKGWSALIISKSS